MVYALVSISEVALRRDMTRIGTFTSHTIYSTRLWKSSLQKPILFRFCICFVLVLPPCATPTKVTSQMPGARSILKYS